MIAREGSRRSISRNFNPDEYDDIKRWLDKLSGGIQEDQMSWLNPEDYMIDNFYKGFKLLVY